jgi:geranylgeranyl diphosphate synthase, type I
MSLESFIQLSRPAVEHELQELLKAWIPEDCGVLRSMIAYHMGWEGDGSGAEAQGKRVRSLLILLTSAAAGGNWQKSLPAAAAVEYIHNFSLVHDDIQDNSHTRRGRSTVWVKWGIPQAINVGDAMYTLGLLSLSKPRESLSGEIAESSAFILQQACIKLTQGQYLDMSHEKERFIPLGTYWPMVEGKTAALLSACTEIGAVVAGIDARRQANFKKFGYSLGLAFQVVDDWLGIWGNTEKTGKSVGDDLVAGKKTLPILFALSQKKNFAERWSAGPIQAREVERLSGWLIDEGAKSYTEEMADNLTKDALFSLKRAVIDENDYSVALKELAESLLKREN